MFYLAAVKKEDINWLFLSAKNRILKTIKKQKDFDLLKKHGKTFVYKWLKIRHLPNKNKPLLIALSVQKKYIPRSVDRNRLKRWSKEQVKNFQKDGKIIIRFLSKEDFFYKKLKRQEFNKVFNGLMEKIK